jgi:trans-2,3-dihydro-3-hydroxyanthranilate isomerase
VDDPLALISSLDPFDSARRGGSTGLRRYLVLDVFTDQPLQGNQLAVFTDGSGLSGAEMQRVARELNLSETVFLLPPAEGGSVRIRIFTPADELPFAGHPVLGSAVVAGAGLGLAAVVLETAAGPVPVTLQEMDGRAVFGRMEQPIPSWHEYERASELLAALGVERSLLPLEVYVNGPHHVYVMLEDERSVARLEPDLRALQRLGAVEANCFAGSRGRWKTRMFAPALGVAEDPATGSAAGPLAVHLARHGRIAFGEEIEIRQGAEIGRASLLYAQADGSAETVERVLVGGAALVVAAGEFCL